MKLQDTNPELAAKLSALIRQLYKMGVKLEGCGCCAKNVVTIDGVEYGLTGSMIGDDEFGYSVYDMKDTVRNELLEIDEPTHLGSLYFKMEE